MSRVHLCLGRLADNPYTFEKSRIRVFSIEELCFFLRENAYLRPAGSGTEAEYAFKK